MLVTDADLTAGVDPRHPAARAGRHRPGGGHVGGGPRARPRRRGRAGWPRRSRGHGDGGDDAARAPRRDGLSRCRRRRASAGCISPASAARACPASRASCWPAGITVSRQRRRDSDAARRAARARRERARRARRRHLGHLGAGDTLVVSTRDPRGQPGTGRGEPARDAGRAPGRRAGLGDGRPRGDRGRRDARQDHHHLHAHHGAAASAGLTRLRHRRDLTETGLGAEDGTGRTSWPRRTRATGRSCCCRPTCDHHQRRGRPPGQLREPGGHPGGVHHVRRAGQRNGADLRGRPGRRGRRGAS